MDGLADRKYTLWIALLVTVFFIQTLTCVYAQTTPTPSTRGVRDCGDPIKPNKGDVSFTLTTVNSTAHYFCNKGYDLQGQHSTTCLENGTWEHVLPRCEVKDCGNPRNITNGNVNTFQTTVFAAAIYSCHVGYELQGQENIICLLNGTWEQLLPKCVLRDCGQPRNITNGDVSYNVTTVNSTASYYCHVGYDIQGVHNITCLDNGKWRQPLPRCSIKDCEDPPINITNGDVAYDMTTVNSTAGYSCHVGYELHGQPKIRCLENGTWESDSQDCIIKNCGIPVHINHGDVSYNVTTVNSTASYSCHVGYELHDQDNITCLENGKWENVLPYCFLKDCEQPVHIANGDVSFYWTTVNSTVNYFCHAGYELQGRNNITCLENGTWENVLPDCIVKDCGEPRNLTDGDVIYRNTTFSSTATYVCDDGYTLNGSRHIVCLENGKWDRDLPVCFDCDPPNTTLHGHVEFNTTSVGSTAIYTCDTGYANNFESTMACDVDGVWITPSNKTTVPECLIDCGLPPVWDNTTKYIVGNTTESSVALYLCEPGYHINGTVKSLICEKSGNWTNRVINCVSKACPPINSPHNGSVHQTTANATFTCIDGYRLQGWKSIFCHSGKWSGPVPTCIKRTEAVNNCQGETDARLTTWDETPPGQTLAMPCPDGLEGTISRNCTPNGVWKLPKYSCVKKAVADAENMIKVIESNNVSEEVKSQRIADVLDTLSNSTQTQGTPSSENPPIYDGEIEKVTSILERVANLSQNIVVTKTQTENFIGTTNNLLNPQNSGSYKSLEENQEQEEDNKAVGADKVLQVVGNFAKAVAKSLTAGGKRTIRKDNMLMTVLRVEETENINFPEDSKRNSSTSVFISKHVLRDVESFSGIFYNNLSGLLPTRLTENGRVNNNTFQINAAVMDVQFLKKQNELASQNMNINLKFDNFKKGYFESKCSYWNFNRRSWDTFGCHLDTDHSNTTFTTCICNHTTNFAILMNPSTTPNVDSKALDYISIIGCSISFVSLVVTVAIHGLLWRYLKSDRAKILINLSVALIFSYAIFVGGVDRTENKIACTVIAVALHYIYLVVFFLMLSEGIEIMITVVYVFATISRLRILLPLSWGLPIVIVGVSIGITRTEGYGSEDFCWLSMHGGLIWAFVGPALLVIVANFVLLSIVMTVMFQAKTLKDRAKVEKVKTGVRCLCVLLPLTGGTWVIGVFYVNESMAWIQYVFAVLNSLQGLFIVLFHCILNTQVRQAISKRRRRYKSNTYTKSSASRTISIPRPSGTDRRYTDLYDSSVDTYSESNDNERYDGYWETEMPPRQERSRVSTSVY